MTGWRADAHTRRHWRSCLHEYVTDGRCNECRAIPISGFVQSKHIDYSALPIGSPLLEPPMSKAVEPMKGDGTNRQRFNPSLRG